MKWLLFYLIFFPSSDLDWKIYIHWEEYATLENCKKEQKRISEFDNVVSIWCDANGGMY